MRPLPALAIVSVAVALAAVLVPSVAPETAMAVRDLLADWRSEGRSALVRRLAQTMEGDKKPWLEVLDEDARIFLYHNFLSDSEADHIIELAEPKLKRSSVVNRTGDGSVVTDIRTSSGAFLKRGEDDVIQAIEERIARWTLMPARNGESLQVLRYTKSQEYKGHYDYFSDEKNTRNGGNRFATVLMYLNDVEEGGETVFPKIPAPGGDNGPEFSECARKHLAAKPRKGDAILFHSMKPNGEQELRALHTACPVIKGVKWSAPKWIRVRHFVRNGEWPYYCEDGNPSCEHWATSGECEKNKAYMVGNATHPGRCLKACKACDLLPGFAADGTKIKA